MAQQRRVNRVYTTKDVSCPGNKYNSIECDTHKLGKCVYGHARKIDNVKGPQLFCEWGWRCKYFQGGKCNRNHQFNDYDLSQIKCPREMWTGNCWIHRTSNDCPYFHNGRPGPNHHLYKEKNAANNNNNNNVRVNRLPSTKDLACIIKGCIGDKCLNEYGHPNYRNDKKRYYCQYAAACFKGHRCWNRHNYEWIANNTPKPKEYVCQFTKHRGCNNEDTPHLCTMYHPGGDNGIYGNLGREGYIAQDAAQNEQIEGM